MEERFLRPGGIAPEPSRAAAAARTRGRAALEVVRYFLVLSLVVTAVIAALGLLVGLLTGHGAVQSLIYGLWIGGGILLLFGGSAGGGLSGGGVAARQTAGRRLLPDQMDPLALILIGAVLVGIGVVIAVLTHRA